VLPGVILFCSYIFAYADAMNYGLDDFKVETKNNKGCSDSRLHSNGDNLNSPPLEGRCEEIQFWFPSLIRRGPGGGRKSSFTNPLESPLTKGDTRRATPKPIPSHLQGIGGEGKCGAGGEKSGLAAVCLC
jgi:hypothetical protein